ncbi:TonB-dependent receptor [Aliikangiella maris]|uniref:TonB-dependent receptor n=2 Tax=Aliikangiella maris TaxID=3162458 RepID=A0ABV2BUE5_9GAMM
MNKKIKQPISLRQKRLSHLTSNRYMLAAGLTLASAASWPVLAQNSEEEINLDKLQIEDRTLDTNPYAEPGAPYKAKHSGDTRRIKPLAETPQTVNVLTQTQIKDSGKADLREVLAAQPGITLGTGENGNAFGDRYIIRGHEARSDVFVDGLRDPGMTTRESFAVEQIEITKGPSATFAGRGSTGGAVNSITKQASSEYDFNQIEVGLGTDDYRRLTLDSNTKISDKTAFRANILHAYEEVPERGPADRERNGLALSITHAASDKLSLTGDLYFLDAKDKPDLGVYIIPNGAPVDNLPVYTQAEDFLESTVKTATFQLNYDISDAWVLQNKLRYGTTENGYVVTGARGTRRAEDNTDGDGNTIPGDPVAPGAATVSLSTHQGWQDVDYLVNQTNLFFTTKAGQTKHNWIFSLEYSDLNVLNGVYSVSNKGTTNCVLSGRGGTRPGFCIVDAGGEYITDNQNLLAREIERGNWDSDYSISTTSLSVMDTVDINEQWTVHAGLRVDAFDYSNSAYGRGASEPTAYNYSDELFNGHVGFVYHFAKTANVYFTFGTSTNINGGESDVGANCGYGGICTDAENIGNPDPETTTNLELGTKWSLNNEKLLLTAAVFQMTKSDVMESLPNGTSYEDAGSINTGENQVKGFEISLVGNLTDKWSTMAGLTLMDSAVTESNNPEKLNKRLSNFADDSAYLQLRYQATDNFAIGASATYSSEQYTGQPDTAAGSSYKVPSYTTYDLFANYQVNEHLKLRLNVGNLTNKDYYLAGYRSGAFTYKGDARNTQLSVSYEF